jgi:hypothetical protein
MGKREGKKAKRERGSEREMQGGERERKIGDCLVMLGEQFGYAG